VNAGEQLEVLRRIATQMTISRDVGEVLRTITNALVTTASAVHSLSTRRARPMIRVNCGALPIDLVESELFGHERGAFTSAHARRIGRFELADKSTLFLDEVGELPAEAQPALLRVLEAGEFERIGGAQPVRVDVRVIAATNRDLTTAGGRGSFREDLFYRLSVFSIRVPPLRERPEDIPHLVEHLLVRLKRKFNKPVSGISPSFMDRLLRYSWPGNIRELRNVLERACVLARGPVLEVDRLFEQAQLSDFASAPCEVTTLEDAERQVIRRALQVTSWRISGPKGAAALLASQSEHASLSHGAAGDSQAGAMSRGISRTREISRPP